MRSPSFPVGSCFCTLLQTTPAWCTLTPSPTRFFSNLPNLLLENSTLTQREPPTAPAGIVCVVNALCSSNKLPAAFTAFCLLRRRHALSSYFLCRPISSLLSRSTFLNAHDQGRQLHALVVTLGLQAYPQVISLLTSFYMSAHHLREAYTVVESSWNSTNVLPWNLLISWCSINGMHSDVVRVYEEMVARGVRPNSFTYAPVLSACGEVFNLELGRKVHNVIDKTSHFRSNLFVMNSLVGMYVKCGDLKAAGKLFDGMPERDIVSWNSMISGCAARGMWGAVHDLLEQMQAENLDANTTTWNSIICGNLKTGNYEEALSLISKMRRSRVTIDDVTLIISLDASSRLTTPMLGKEIHGAAIRALFSKLENVCNALITMYSRIKCTREAYVLFRSEKTRGLVRWNAMISGFALADQVENASEIFREMVCSGQRPDYVTIVSILSLLARKINLRHGQEFHCYIIKHEFERCQELCNSLIELYSNSGRIELAQRIFNTMRTPDKFSYTSLIGGYGAGGQGLSALKLFQTSISDGVNPDHITMVAVLSACSHSRLLTEGLQIFEKMDKLFGIIPQMEHYSCMVDLFRNSGLLNETWITSIGFLSNRDMLTVLIRVCLVHGYLDLGARAANFLLEMGSDDPRNYALVARMYESTGRLEELDQLRRSLILKQSPQYNF